MISQRVAIKQNYVKLNQIDIQQKFVKDEQLRQLKLQAELSNNTRQDPHKQKSPLQLKSHEFSDSIDPSKTGNNSRKSSQTKLRESSKKHGVIQQIIQQLNGRESGMSTQNNQFKLNIQEIDKNMDSNDLNLQQNTSLNLQDELNSPIFKIEENIFETFLRNEFSQQKSDNDQKEENSMFGKLQLSKDDSHENLAKDRLINNSKEQNYANNRIANTTPSTPMKQFSKISYNNFQKAMNTEELSISTKMSNRNNMPKYFNQKAIQQVAQKITFKEAMNILRISRADKNQGQKELIKIIQDKKQAMTNQQENLKIHKSHQEQMKDLLAIMEGRDCYGNMQKYHEEMNQLQKQKNVTTNARLAHCQLINFRKVIPKEYLKRTQDFDRINVTMLNEYLNKYAEKLSRGNGQDPFEIQVDFDKYDQILSGIQSSSYNPYFQYIEENQDKKSENLKSKAKVESRYMSIFKQKDEEQKKQNPIAAQQQQQREKEDLKKDLKEIKEKFSPHQAKFKRLYMKSIDINRFENYQTMLQTLKHNRQGSLNQTITPQKQQQHIIQTSDQEEVSSKFMGLRTSKSNNQQSSNRYNLIKTAGMSSTRYENTNNHDRILSTAAHTRLMSPETSTFINQKLNSSGYKKDFFSTRSQNLNESQQFGKSQNRSFLEADDKRNIFYFNQHTLQQLELEKYGKKRRG
eukprot:403341614